MNDYRLFRCIQCGFEYDEALGWPEDGIEPGTRWDDIPEDLELPGLRRGKIRLRDGGGRAAVSAIVAPVKRMPYAEASRVLLRDSVLDAMRDLLLTRDWSAITLSDVARAAGISRQTIYNEFGSRQGLAQGYALRLADRLVDTVHAGLDANVGNIYEAFLQGFRNFFSESASDPLVISLLSGVAKPDLLQIITTDSAPIVTRASARLTSAFTQSWVATSDEDAGVLARAIVRLALSYVSMPPEADHDVAADLARLMTPFAERHGVVNVPDLPGPWAPKCHRLQWRKSVPKLTNAE